jgi:hypothetical protein
LLKLGIQVSKRTIQKYIAKVRRASGQTWATFLKNQAGDIWACDFTVVFDLLFRPLYIFIILELKTRRVVHTLGHEKLSVITLFWPVPVIDQQCVAEEPLNPSVKSLISPLKHPWMKQVANTATQHKSHAVWHLKTDLAF